MSTILFSLPELYNSYKAWVSQNPQAASDCETTAKWISYFIAGRINNSHILTELIYSLSNLLVLYNDTIISNSRQLTLPSSGDRIKLWLTVLEYSEVFLELSAQKLWGKKGKWIVIVGIQVFKCISRLFLIYSHKESIIQHPPILPLERRKLMTDGASYSANNATEITQVQLDSISYTLRRSGKIVRKVESSPPVSLRNWKPLECTSLCDNEQTVEKSLAGRQLIAETIYVLKPVAHLGSLVCFGDKTWKPWMVSLIMDLSSLHLYQTCKKTRANSLTQKQRLQLSRRTVMLLLYLLRSPFYEKHSKDKINALLFALSNNVPLLGLICNPLAKYLPFWQSNYFYMWAT